jgi:hypothetical protein
VDRHKERPSRRSSAYELHTSSPCFHHHRPHNGSPALLSA